MTLPLINLLIATLFLSLLTHWVGYMKGFFIPPASRWHSECSASHSFASFSFFLLLYLFLPPMVSSLFTRAWPTLDHFDRGLWVMFTVSVCLSIMLLVYGWICTSSKPRSLSLLRQALFAGLTYLIALPVVVFTASLFTLINVVIFNQKGEDQMAVLFLKQAIQNPFNATLALIMICVTAPLIEEILFRRIFFRALRALSSFWVSACLSSMAFTLIHYSPTQGIGNFPLLATLFVFSLYLSYLYERQKSLIAPLILHAIFNLMSALRIMIV